LKPPLKILLYFVAVLLVGSFLAAPLFWAARGLAPAAGARGWLRYELQKNGETDAKGWCSFLVEDFSKVSNRAVILAAVVLLWPLLRSLRIRSAAELGLDRNPNRWRDFTVGYAISIAVMVSLAFILLKLGVYEMKVPTIWSRVVWVAATALLVGIFEEWLFRGAFLGTFRQCMGPYAALASVTAFFAVVHFLKSPSSAIAPENVHWLSGFAILPECFGRFADPVEFLAGYTTYFLFGWICGWAVLRTRGLALSVGFHAGMVLGKFGFGRIAERPRKMRDLLPWMGEDMVVGIIGSGVVVLVGVLLWWYVRFLRRQPPE
jgi:membrane protease YdiL (CAAX protease family)